MGFGGEGFGLGVWVAFSLLTSSLGKILRCQICSVRADCKDQVLSDRVHVFGSSQEKHACTGSSGRWGSISFGGKRERVGEYKSRSKHVSL